MLTWPQPAAITYGTALGNSQLNATANVPGTFVYTPPVRTVLPVGSGQTLSVAFTPSDQANYNAASASTTINVNARTQIIVTRVLSRDGSNNIVVQLTLANTGGTAASNVTITGVKVGSISAPSLPIAVGTIAAGSSVQAPVNIGNPVGASGAASSLTVSGTYTGGTFSLNSRITLP